MLVRVHLQVLLVLPVVQACLCCRLGCGCVTPQSPFTSVTSVTCSSGRQVGLVVLLCWFAFIRCLNDQMLLGSGTGGEAVSV